MVNGEIPYGIEEGGIEEAFAIWMGSIWEGRVNFIKSRGIRPT